MNSFTSRPRSPTRPITIASASVLRASIAIKVDLPTPEPEKMPMRWPLQQVANALSARTPRSSLPPMRAARMRGRRRCLQRIGLRALRQRALAVLRLAEPSSTRPSQAGDGIDRGRLVVESRRARPA